MARSICDVGYSRLLYDADLCLFSVHGWYQCPILLLVLDGEGHYFANYFARILCSARIWTVMARSR
jgi:hypothetical protein